MVLRVLSIQLLLHPESGVWRHTPRRELPGDSNLAFISMDTCRGRGRELIGNAMGILFIIFVCDQFTFLANILLGLFTKNK